MNPKIALVVSDVESNKDIKAVKPDLLELRVDLFRKKDTAYVVDQIKKRRALRIPLLLTVRNQKKEGASREFSDTQKETIIQAALPLVDMVDIELSSPLLKKVTSLARAGKKKIMVSKHDFNHTPHDINTIYKKALSTRADIIKLSFKANTLADVMRLVEWTAHHQKHPIVTLSMGPIGRISRLILPAAGSFYAYTFLNQPKAPGQIDVKTLKAHLKFYYP